jgi:hypothetical protein
MVLDGKLEAVGLVVLPNAKYPSTGARGGEKIPRPFESFQKSILCTSDQSPADRAGPRLVPESHTTVVTAQYHTITVPHAVTTVTLIKLLL